MLPNLIAKLLFPDVVSTHKETYFHGAGSNPVGDANIMLIEQPAHKHLIRGY